MNNPVIDLMFYQYLHDKNYHHDIYVLNRKARLNHLIHHLHKYNNSGIKPAHWLEDMLACILSMAGTMNLHLDKELSKLLHTEVKEIEDIKSLYATEVIDAKLDEYLRLLSKTMESLDHVEDFDFNGSLRESITNLFLIVFQLNILENRNSNFDLIVSWMKRLEMIKVRHCFHSYFDSNLRGGCDTYVKMRVKYLNESSVAHQIHAPQSIQIVSVG